MSGSIKNLILYSVGIIAGCSYLVGMIIGELTFDIVAKDLKPKSIFYCDLLDILLTFHLKWIFRIKFETIATGVLVLL